MDNPKNLEDTIIHMKTIGEQLVDYNFPRADPRLENELNILKTKEVMVDGYQVVLHFSKADYRSHYLETLQVLGKNTPFLPFNLVVKIARRFLGSSNLSLVELLRDNRKIYCWTVTLNRRGIPIASAHQHPAEICKFEDFHYAYMDPQHVNFY